MNIYYFTFGFGQKFEGHVQPIIAESSMIARYKMVSIFGDKWAFQYGEDEYLESIENSISQEKFLPPILVEEIDKDGE